MPQQPPIVVFSHLRWDFVFQRPQHLMSRLAKDQPVLFIEEPVCAEGQPPRWECNQPLDGLTVCKLRSPCTTPGFCADQIALLREHLPSLLREQNATDAIAWFYTPLALPLVEFVHPLAIVYDCMDELSAFRFAPKELQEREAELLRRADVVFTGGPSLYEAKRHRHPNVHCFPSSVDLQHFGRAAKGLEEPKSQAELPRPRLGYFGVIDERFDADIVDLLASQRPHWQIILIGPVVKIDPATLPRRANIHYLGQCDYAALPAYVSGWDVCLLPFARNEATRYISPTKTLEYMAAERPIVSTPITDVARPYGSIVYLGEGPQEFLAACDQALAQDAATREHRAALMREVLARTSWDATTRQMQELVGQAVAHNRQRARAANQLSALPSEQATDAAGSADGDDSERARRSNSETTGSAALSAPVVVVGAGPTGLSAAYHLGKDALLLEQHDQVGGWCRSIESKGFTFDFAGHIMFSNDPYVHEMYARLLGDNVHWQDREAWIYSKEVFTRYPFQGALYGLPPDVIKECILGVIEARFGPLNNSPERTPSPSGGQRPEQIAGNGHAVAGSNGHGNPRAIPTASGNGERNGKDNGRNNGRAGANVGRAENREVYVNRERSHNGSTRPTADNWCQPGSITDCCADGVLESTAALHKAQPKSGSSESSPPGNFEEFIYKVWGAGIARHFAIPYNRKLWAVPLAEMETSWLGGRVPLPDLEEMIEGALRPVPKPMGPNARFGYPLRGGFQALMNGFLPLLQGELRFQSRVAQVMPGSRQLRLQDGTSVRYEQMISTMPLPVLIHLMGDEAPQSVRAAAAALRYVSVRCVHLGIGREKLTEKHWIYYPEDTVFHRIFVQGNASPECNPPGGFGLTCEITYHPQYKPLACDGDELVQRCIEDCRRVGLFRANDPVWTALQVDMPHAYVVYDHARPQHVAHIRQWLATQGILLAGRYSEWEYYNSDHAFLAGRKAAEAARQAIAHAADVTQV